MGRLSLNYRSGRNLWLARMIVSRQPLLRRMARYQLLPQMLGLTAEMPERTSFLVKRSLDQGQQVALPPIRRVFRPAFVELAQGDQEIPPMLDESEEVSARQVASMNSPMEVQDQGPVSIDQPLELLEIELPEVQRQVSLPEQQIEESAEPSVSEPEAPVIHHQDAHQPGNIDEPVEPRLQQEQVHIDNQARPVEQVKAKRPRGRIEEQSVEAERVPLPPSSSSRVTHRANQGMKVLKGTDVQVEQASSEVISADNLFAPRDTDRSPQAWLARLIGSSATSSDNATSSPALSRTRQDGGQAQPVSNEQSESEQPGKVEGPLLPPDMEGDFTPAGEGSFVATPQAQRNGRTETSSQTQMIEKASVARPVTPLSQGTRRFLQPLLGVDPAGIRVYRDSVAERLTDAYQADAITLGGDVELAVGHQDDTPETLGLLAHELTHVARLREPRFVPPVARATPAQSSSMSEEALALRVESRVKRVAQEQIDQTGLISTEPAGVAVELSAGTTSLMPASRSQRETWGGLPAPWEPLPDWLVASRQTGESSTQPAAIPAQPIQVGHRNVGGESRVSGTHGGSDTRTGGIPGNAGVQRAGQERSSSLEEAQTTPSASQASPDAAKTPEPDLDALARQVYSLLKRRLGVEYRRDS